VSFVPVTRDGSNDVLMLDPSSEEGRKLVQMVKDSSANLPPLRIDGQEVVMLEGRTESTSRRR
jgi:hypothetical protein